MWARDVSFLRACLPCCRAGRSSSANFSTPVTWGDLMSLFLYYLGIFNVSRWKLRIQSSEMRQLISACLRTWCILSDEEHGTTDILELKRSANVVNCGCWTFKAQLFFFLQFLPVTVKPWYNKVHKIDTLLHYLETSFFMPKRQVDPRNLLATWFSC